MTLVRSLTVVAFAALALVACGDDETPAGPGTDSTLPTVAALSGTWRAVTGVVDDAPVVMDDDVSVTVTVEDAEISGRAACNAYGGEVDLGAGTFRAEGLSWTEMGCEPAVMAVEQAFLRSITEFDSWTLAGDVLTLRGPTTSWTFEPVPPVPDAEIAGTTWVLDTVLVGETSSHSDVMSLATLRLDPDGTLTGSTSCRRLEGDWSVSGGEIVLARFAAIDDPTAGICAPESQQLDSTIVTVLGDGFVAEVDGDRLTIRSQGDVGLSYTASGD